VREVTTAPSDSVTPADGKESVPPEEEMMASACASGIKPGVEDGELIKFGAGVEVKVRDEVVTAAEDGLAVAKRDESDGWDVSRGGVEEGAGGGAGVVVLEGGGVEESCAEEAGVVV